MRTTIPVMTAERLQGRLSLWMLAAAQGNEQLIDRIETTIAVVTVIGFAPDIVNELVASAAKEAGLSVDDALARFGLAVKEVTPRKKRGE